MKYEHELKIGDHLYKATTVYCSSIVEYVVTEVHDIGESFLYVVQDLKDRDCRDPRRILIAHETETSFVVAEQLCADEHDMYDCVHETDKYSRYCTTKKETAFIYARAANHDIEMSVIKEKQRHTEAMSRLEKSRKQYELWVESLK